MNSPDEPLLEKTELFCVYCGQGGVTVESGDGDYYVGSRHYCNSCEKDFTWQ